MPGWRPRPPCCSRSAPASRLSGAELRYERGQLALRLGPGRRTSPAAAAPRRRRATAREIQALRAELRPAGRRRAAAEADDLLRSVQEMIRESEARQDGSARRQPRATSAERAEAQRRYDLARVSAGLSYLDGKTGCRLARTTELMGHVLQASQKK